MKDVVKLLKIKINSTKGIPIIENPNNQTNEIVNKLLDRVLNRIFLVSNLVFKEVSFIYRNLLLYIIYWKFMVKQTSNIKLFLKK